MISRRNVYNCTNNPPREQQPEDKHNVELLVQNSFSTRCFVVHCFLTSCSTLTAISSDIRVEQLVALGGMAVTANMIQKGRLQDEQVLIGMGCF